MANVSISSYVSTSSTWVSTLLTSLPSTPASDLTYFTQLASLTLQTSTKPSYTEFLRRVSCPIFTILWAPWAGRPAGGGRRQRATPSRLWKSVCFYYTQNIPILISLGSNLGGIVRLWRLSSVQLGWWGCRMNPASGRPITVAPSPLKGRKRKKERRPRRSLYLSQVPREHVSQFALRRMTERHVGVV